MGTRSHSPTRDVWWFDGIPTGRHPYSRRPPRALLVLSAVAVHKRRRDIIRALYHDHDVRGCGVLLREYEMEGWLTITGGHRQRIALTEEGQIHLVELEMEHG